jgi:hypothetical protein
MDMDKVVLAGLAAIVFSVAAPCQTAPLALLADRAETPGFQVNALRMGTPAEGAVGSETTHDMG